MASRLDQALDDVIKDRRSERSNTHSNNNSNRSSRRDVRPSFRRGGGSDIRKRLGPSFHNRTGNGNSSSSSSGVGPIRSFVRTVDVNKRGGGGRNVDGQWAHDKFDDSGDSILSRLGSTPYQRSGDRTQRNRTIELNVENLHYNVTEKDLEELFSTVGEISKARIKFDPSGRSTGVAFVQYYNMADAEKAVETYNNVELDGKAMRVEIKERDSAPRSSTSNRSRFGGGRYSNNNSNRYDRSNGRGTRDNRDSRRPRDNHRRGRDDRNPKQELTAEDLDKDLDSYMQTNNAPSEQADDMMVD